MKLNMPIPVGSGGTTLVSTGVGAIEPGGGGGGDDNGQDVIDNPQDDIKPVGEEFIEVSFLWIYFYFMKFMCSF
jgi:hypothetical protein